eukprot:scaffold71174_cov74-Phaeocystis_antarctica.AAC.1
MLSPVCTIRPSALSSTTLPHTTQPWPWPSREESTGTCETASPRPSQSARSTHTTAQMSAEVSVVASTLERLTFGNLRKKARAVPTGSASPEHMTCARQAGSESAAQISVVIWSWPGVRQSIQSTRRSAR